MEDRSAPDDDVLVDALVQLAFEVMGVVSRTAARHDLSLTLLRLLAILRDREPTPGELAAHLGLDRSTITGLVDRGIRRGLLERRANPVDRRSSTVALSAAGRDLAAAGGGEIAMALAPAGRGIAAEGRADLVAQLTTATRLLAAARGDGTGTFIPHSSEHPAPDQAPKVR